MRDVVLLVAGQEDDLLARLGLRRLVGPSQLVCGPAYLATAALASDTASAMDGATANSATSATAPPNRAWGLTSTFIALLPFSCSRLRVELDFISNYGLAPQLARMPRFGFLPRAPTSSLPADASRLQRYINPMTGASRARAAPRSEGPSVTPSAPRGRSRLKSDHYWRNYPAYETNVNLRFKRA